MNISLSKLARQDIKDIRDYIAQDNEAAADRSVTRLFQSMRHLEDFPLMARPGRVEGTRELSVPGLPFVIVLEIASQTDLTILRIFHTSQKWPPQLK